MSIASNDGKYLGMVELDTNYVWRVHKSNGMTLKGEPITNAFFSIEIQDPEDGKYYKTRKSAFIGHNGNQQYVTIAVNCRSILSGHVEIVSVHSVTSIHFEKISKDYWMRFEKADNRIVLYFVNKINYSKSSIE